ncbi:MAG: flagellar motor protein MotB [Campylobacterota bacterium]|nr:flagellar motor protein MotB [Campylobacterota bacterium]
MAKKKCPDCPKCLPGWLVQFGDLMSLLLCFFILLLSMATMDKKKVEEYFEIMRRSMGFLEGAMDTAEAQEESLSQYHADKSEAGSSDDMGADEQAADVAQLVEEVTQEFNDTSDKENQKVDMTMKGNNEFTLDIPSSLMFTEGEYSLDNPNAKRFITKLSRILRTMTQEFDIEVIGHTGSNYLRGDGIPRDSWDLSALRSISVIKELIKNQIDPATLKVAAFGSYRPKSDNAFENRRVELRFTATSQDNDRMAKEENFFDRLEE